MIFYNLQKDEEQRLKAEKDEEERLAKEREEYEKFVNGPKKKRRKEVQNITQKDPFWKTHMNMFLVIAFSICMLALLIHKSINV